MFMIRMTAGEDHDVVAVRSGEAMDGAGQGVRVVRLAGIGDNDGMQSGAHSRRWWVGAGVTMVAAMAGLVALVWFLTTQGLDKSDQWAGIIALLLAYLVASASLVAWLVRRALSEGTAEQGEKAEVLNVTAKRDAYTAETMTFHRDISDTSDDGKPSK